MLQPEKGPSQLALTKHVLLKTEDTLRLGKKILLVLACLRQRRSFSKSSSKGREPEL